ncbi:MAG: amidohydrolase family protein [Alphaproteobacteria bacterium]|nr:amidohydrolase family protein [Alphaproteobacteria bacterium]
MSTHDLVIRNGTLYDGSGAPPVQADVAVDDGRITAVGSVPGQGRREIDATGCIVTPGFVDIHTHYDAQATWDPYLSPSSSHGVTTVVMGNCGVGFAPARPGDRATLIDLMEGVEDIPGAAMHEGIQWEWEQFPEFMDALEKRPHAIDYGVQVPHCALRVYVMGQRGADNEDATPDDIARMAEIVRQSLRAGALGFSTSRTDLHNTLQGEPVPGTHAALDEVFGIGQALADENAGVYQMALTHLEMDENFKWMRRLAETIRRPVTFNLQQVDQRPALYQELLGMLDDCREQGLTWLRGQFSGRPVSVLMGWRTSANPFTGRPTWHKLFASAPWDEVYEQLKRPEVRAAILNDTAQGLNPFETFVANAFHKMFPLGDPPDYEPGPEDSVAAIAAREGVDPREVIYDTMMAQGGEGLLYFPLFGYSTGDLSAIRETMLHPQTGLSLSDGGAHVGAICDAGTPTFMLTHWARDRRRGEQVPLAFIIKRQTRDTAVQYGLMDRGLVKPGYKADLNVIDFDRLQLDPPHMRYDLPAGGRRLYQGAQGYVTTIVSGVPIMEDGAPTGALPGKLIRGHQGR